MYERCLARGAGALEDCQLATAFVDRRQYFVSEASVYCLLKAHGLLASPAFILMKAGDRFAQPCRYGKPHPKVTGRLGSDIGTAMVEFLARLLLIARCAWSKLRQL